MATFKNIKHATESVSTIQENQASQYSSEYNVEDNAFTDALQGTIDELKASLIQELKDKEKAFFDANHIAHIAYQELLEASRKVQDAFIYEPLKTENNG